MIYFSQRCIALCTDNEVIKKINESYLELVVLKDGIKNARKFYKRYVTALYDCFSNLSENWSFNFVKRFNLFVFCRLCKENSVSVSFYQKCLRIEESQVSSDIF